MTIIHAPKELSSRDRGVCLALGFFDGVHIGHQRIISETISQASKTRSTAVVITFDRHPSTVVAPNHIPRLIYTLPQKIRAIGQLKPDSLLLFRFDKEFSLQTGEAFVRSLAAGFPPIHSICVGANFVFGYKRGGNVELLQQLGSELAFTVHAIPPVTLHGKSVSSTRIRNAIAGGDLNGVNEMLGRPYSIAGIVVRGDELGRRLGYPTANLDVSGVATPPSGVYAVSTSIDGASYLGALNVGHRPTLRNPAPELRVEVHLLDFHGNLYGREVELIVERKLREEIRFPSVEHLQTQIASDLAEIRSFRGQ